ncbi:hypothetical protein [Micromonospora sp. WMMD1082]|uniref:hypothetical protein n=1 Tax=Micromonospora sp. WMMD1082 TaxID=3016104 RepID=UPI002415D523|nr:hypothetical protein [Micromonospora sp. WMMD1082]MDG4793532.1 hypothetical protein [Micromonospora sp. WMMD1082]
MIRDQTGPDTTPINLNHIQFPAVRSVVMWSEIVAFIVQTAWPILPEVTIGLRFVTALIGFALAIGLLQRRIRRWARQADRRPEQRR